jgi:CubicO group peptidase (beta-lactamase class C family)
MDDKKIHKIDKILKDNQFNGAILINENQEIAFKKYYGKANMEWDIPLKEESIFRIASISKTFTASAILKLVENKSLNLDQTIDLYFEDFPRGNEITIHHLLSNSSGVPNFDLSSDFREVLQSNNPNYELINLFKNKPLLFNPGEQWSYSMSGYILLGNIIEIIAKKSYIDYIKEDLINHTKLHNVYYDNYQDIISNRVSGYDRLEKELKNATFIDMKIAGAGGGMLSSIEDINRFNIHLLNGDIISKNLVAQLFSNQIEIDESTGYGYGIIVSKKIVNNEEIIRHYHSGGGMGVRAINVFYPKINIILTLLSNINDLNRFNETFNEIEKIIFK